LWLFDPDSQLWSRMGGCDGPGARWAARTWIGADGTLWLSGGLEMLAEGSARVLEDTWQFVPATGLWSQSPFDAAASAVQSPSLPEGLRKASWSGWP
jgi:hypothetical protein